MYKKKYFSFFIFEGEEDEKERRREASERVLP
jgi:hypothetical protein